MAEINGKPVRYDGSVCCGSVYVEVVQHVEVVQYVLIVWIFYISAVHSSTGPAVSPKCSTQSDICDSANRCWCIRVGMILFEALLSSSLPYSSA